MEYEPKTYFTEGERDDVKGFTLLAAKNGRYHIAEKWLATEENRATEDKWLDYWIPEDELLDRHDKGKCEPKGKLTNEQFEAVCDRVGWDYTENQTEEIAA